LGIVGAVCATSIFLTTYHATYTGDKVTLVFGYFFSLVIVPLLIVTFLAFLARKVLPYELNQVQKWLLFIIPVGFLTLLVSYFFLALQHANH